MYVPTDFSPFQLKQCRFRELNSDQRKGRHEEEKKQMEEEKKAQGNA